VNRFTLQRSESLSINRTSDDWFRVTDRYPLTSGPVERIFADSLDSFENRTGEGGANLAIADSNCRKVVIGV